MKRILVTCIGITDLMMDRMTEETLEGIRQKVQIPVDRTRPAIKEAGEKVYRGEDGSIGLPTENVFACLREGGRFVKYDTRKYITTEKDTLLPAFLFIEEAFIPLHNGVHGIERRALTDSDWVVDKRRGINKDRGKETAICVTRPRFKIWGFTMTVLVDEKQVHVDRIKELVQKAGLCKGLCAARRKLPFGRFKVVEWELLGEPSVDG